MRPGKDFLEWLEQKIATLPPGERLPTDSALGEQWGLSPRSIRRLMSQPARKGLVERIPGKGTFKAGGTRAAPKNLAVEHSSVERLCQHLIDSVASGKIRRGEPLPQVKYLRLQYRVSQKTVVAAYRALQAKGIVSQVGKRFWVGGFTPYNPRVFSSEAYLVVQKQEDLKRVFTSNILAPACERMERTLRSCGIMLKYATEAELESKIREWTKNDSYPAGVIVWGFDGDRAADLGRLLKPLVQRDRKARIPILIDLANHGLIHDLPFEARILSEGNLTTTRARAIARYVSSHPRQRTVLLYSWESVRSNLKTAFLRYQKIAFEITATGEALEQAVVCNDQSISADGLMDEIRSKEPEYLRYLRDKYECGKPNATGFASAISVVAGLDEVVKRFGGPAHWICVTDALADEALAMLRKSGVDVPGQVSIVTLENLPEFYPLGLSACAIDWDLVGYLMAHAIVGDIPLKKTSHGFLKVDCEVIERLT